MRAFSTMWVTCIVGVVTGCLYGLRARARHPMDLGAHLITTLSDPRAWAYVLLPTIVLLIAWRSRWHGGPEALARFGSRREQARTGLREGATCTALGTVGLVAGGLASATGLRVSLTVGEAAQVGTLMIALAATTTVLAAFTAWANHRSPGLGAVVAGGLLLWAICEIGVPGLAPPRGPVFWAFPDTRHGVSLCHLLPVLALVVVWGALRGSRWWRRRGDLVMVLTASVLWTLAAPRLLASTPADAQERLLVTWWGFGEGLFDPIVHTAHWLVTSLPVLLLLNEWDRPWLQQTPLRVSRHGRPGPLVRGALCHTLLLSGVGALSSVATALVVHGPLSPSGVATWVELTLGWLVHTAFWGTVGLANTWWFGNPQTGQLIVLSTLLLAPIAPWSSTGLPLGLAALGQHSAFSPALLWLVPAALGMALVLHRSPVPGQGRDL